MSKDVLEIFARCPRYGGITWTATTFPYWTEQELRLHMNGASRRRFADDNDRSIDSGSGPDLPAERTKSPAGGAGPGTTSECASSQRG
jgi:hypothetical protein